MTRSEGLLEEILERVDIAEYISQYVDLKKTGSSFKGLCPFHDERTPSFSVTPEKKLYHCFGCGAAGNVVGFAMKYHNLDFVDAMKMLCERYNIVFEQRERPR
ncbi:MAG: DNA primase, partial [Flexistipes sinusarabici]